MASGYCALQGQVESTLGVKLGLALNPVVQHTARLDAHAVAALEAVVMNHMGTVATVRTAQRQQGVRPSGLKAGYRQVDDLTPSGKLVQVARPTPENIPAQGGTSLFLRGTVSPS